MLEKVTGALGDRCAIVAEGEPVPPTGRALVASKPIAAGPSLIIVFQAFADGLPISDGAVKVELRRTKAGLVPVSVVGRFHPAARVSGTVSPQVETALERSYPSVRGSGFELRPARRLVAHEVAGGEHRRAFEVTASTSLTSAERSFVDAETGEVLLSYPLTCEGTAHALAYETDPGHGDRQALPLGGLYVSKGRKRVVTRDDGAFSLKGTVSLAEGFSGPRVRVVPDGERAFSYEGPADFTLLGSASSSRTWHEDEAAAFYHAMSYNSYMTETYPDVTEAARVRFAIVVASSFENAFFSPTTVETDDGESFPGYVDLGTIARHSLARDGSVVKHEYTHALLNGVAYLYGNDEASGVNEGLADYFPCAQAESPRIGTWAHAPYVRALDDKPHKLVWPRDAERAGYEVHRIGNIFNQALWQARTAAERAGRGERLRVDQAVFGGVLRMPSSPSLLDAREAILAADEAENDSAHVRLLEDAFLDHGIAAAD
ncbi:M36 family metallopeptidase [bacterium]|nr:M36 family metallopeptidase [bacterium]